MTKLPMDALTCPSCGKSLPRPAAAGGPAVCLFCGQVFQHPSSSTPDQPSTVRWGERPPPRVVPTKVALTLSEPGPNGEADTPPHFSLPSLSFLSPAQAPGELGRLGPYRVLQVLGAGGMGVVFQAEDPQLRRRVALKVIAPRLAGDPSARQRFFREARAAAAIEHVHVVAIHQIGEADGVPFVAMPLLKGESLAARFHRHQGAPLPVPEVIRIGAEVARGLEAVHANGLIHRDVKPGNIWLEEPGDRVKILDFGLVYSFAEETSLTQPGAGLGTPTYMAPEQSSGGGIDHRADLFSLGCVLYRAATGKMPFRTPDETPLPPFLAATDADPPTALRPQLPAELSGLILRMLSRGRQDRPESAREVAESLEALERALPPSEAEPDEGRAKARSRRRRLDLGSGLAVLMVAAVPALYVATDQGTLKVETLDPEVKVVVERGGRVVTTIDPRSTKEVRLRAGEYTLRPDVDRQDVTVVPGRITLGRGGEEVATVTPVGPEAEWIASVAAMPADMQAKAVEARLRERNPGFDSKVFRTIDNGVVTGLFLFTDKVTDLSPVRALMGLKSLEARGDSPGKGQLADLSPLKGMALTTLICGNNPIADLEPLRGMPLQKLTFGNSKVEDLEPLRGMPLKVLDFWGNRVADLGPLRDMKLERLNCANNPLTDLEPLRGMPLKSIYCDYEPGARAEVLRSLKLLETIRGKPADEFWKDEEGDR